MTKPNTLPERKNVKEQNKWRLEDIYLTDSAFETDFQKAKDGIAVLHRFEGTLLQNPQNLRHCLDEVMGQRRRVERTFVYARMRRDEDNANTVYQALTDRAYSLMVELGTQTAYVVPEILQMDEPTFKEYIAQESALSVYSRYFDEIFRNRAHILSASEEKLLAQAGEMAETPDTVYSMLHDADLKFPTITDENGQTVEITHGNFIRLMENKDRRVRQDAYTALYKTYKAYLNTIAALLAGSVKKDMFEAKSRKYTSTRHMALQADFVKISVYDKLIEGVHRSLHVMTDYIKLRKKLLGFSSLHMFDLYVPLFAESERNYAYKEACALVQKAVEPLGQDYGNVVAQAYEDRWIDVYENRGKTSGAYSWGTYGVHPYVLLNYQERLDDVFTLAHEMGHAMHSYYSNKTQPYVNAAYRIFVAEVASTVNELLLLAHLKKNCTDRNMKKYLLNHYLDQVRTTVFRQTMFAEFERDFHQRAESGEAVTPDWLCARYNELNTLYYGKEIQQDDLIPCEWARIPHFYSTFYVYKYATGFSAAVDISRRILAGEKGAVENYLAFLSSGGSDDPLVLLQKAGVNLQTEKPVLACMQSFEETLIELSELLREEGTL